MLERVTIPFLTAFLLGCSTAGQTSSDLNWIEIDSTDAQSRLSGVWRNPALGHVAVFSDGNTEIFHEYSDLCVADTGVVPAFSLVSFDERSDRAYFNYYDFSENPGLLQNPLEYVQLQQAPQKCLDQSLVADIPLIDVFDLVWEVFDRHYAAFEERGVDWDAQREVFRPRVLSVNTDDELFDLISEMLAPLRDGHVNLTLKDRFFKTGRPKLRQRLAMEWAKTDRSVSEGAFVGDWSRTVRDSAINLLDAGTHRVGANGALEWGVISGDVGYLRINRFGGFVKEAPSRKDDLAALREALLSISKELDSTKRLIVDVAHNGGGNDAAAITVVEHFLETPRNVLTYRVSGLPDRNIQLSPSRDGAVKNITLVTSEITASAAEAFVLMMRALPNVEHVGEPTRGDISSLLPKPLPHGFRVTVAYQQVLDPSGNWYEGQGIPPERDVDLFPENGLFGGYAKAIQLLADEEHQMP